MKILALPGGEFINLELVRRIETELDPPVARIIWARDETRVYHAERASAIIEALNEDLSCWDLIDKRPKPPAAKSSDPGDIPF
ncbi:hypothetical protein Glo7428_3768 [Gloeocapsa sp. PCC 7428]|uniref:hypothetical protein n=1 Tax=Gloeocapsa sp. PCC 7428 TaxID=1173026 RepID=UPI0002A5C5B8|nr:hypothetical protein [Gloeocapsa sp. PCC 7428]AFZ32228.1 hypothetical protein Glo7428_3768 [Gloeocapsa sp. PCC 7428]